MANYKITVEALGPDVDVAEELRHGMECDGFFMVAHTELSETKSSNAVSIYEISAIDMAIAIAKSTELLEAAMIAHGMEKGRLMRKDRERARGPEMLAALLKQAAEDD